MFRNILTRAPEKKEKAYSSAPFLFFFIIIDLEARVSCLHIPCDNKMLNKKVNILSVRLAGIGSLKGKKGKEERKSERERERGREEEKKSIA